MMATIPTYQRSVLPSAGGGSPRIGSDSSVSGGLADISRSIGGVAEMFARKDQQQTAETARADAMFRQAMERKQAEDAHAWTAEALTNDHVSWDDWMATAKETAKPGAAGFAGDFLKKFDTQTTEALAATPDEQTKAFYKNRRLALRTSLFDNARRFEAEAGVRHRDTQWDTAITNAAQVAARDPEQAKVMTAELVASLDAGPDQQVSAIRKKKLTESVTRSAAQGLIERNPELALRTLDQFFGVKPNAGVSTKDGGPVATEDLFGAVIHQESRGKHTDASGKLTTSSAGAQGITQLMPATAANPGYGITPVKDQSEAEYKRVGKEYLDAMLREFGGDQAKALAAYNAGPGAVQKAVTRAGDDWLSVMPAETKDYVSKINARVSGSQAVLMASIDPAQAVQALKEKPSSGNWYIDQLDTQTAWTMRNAAQAEVHRLQTAERARRAESDKRVGGEVKKLVDMMKDGFAPKADTLSIVQDASRGTEWEAPLVQAQQTFTATSAFRVMPQDQRTALLDQFRAKGNTQQWTSQEASLFETLTALDGKVRDAYKTDPLRAGAMQGLYAAPAPMDMQSLAAMQQTLPERLSQAAAVGQRTGKVESPFMANEADQMVSKLAQLLPKERSEYVAQLSETLGPQTAHAVAKQLDERDKALSLAFAFAGDKTTNGRYTSELILKGAQAKKDGTSTKGEEQPEMKVANWSAKLAAELKDVFPTPVMADQAREAALLISHGIAAEADGKLTDKDMARAASLAANGPIIDHKDRRTVLPGGMTADDFERRLSSITPAMFGSQVSDGIVRAGGADVPLEDFVKKLPSQPLMYAAPGRYFVLVNGRPAVNTQGKPLVVSAF